MKDKKFSERLAQMNKDRRAKAELLAVRWSDAFAAEWIENHRSRPRCEAVELARAVEAMEQPGELCARALGRAYARMMWVDKAPTHHEGMFNAPKLKCSMSNEDVEKALAGVDRAFSGPKRANLRLAFIEQLSGNPMRSSGLVGRWLALALERDDTTWIEQAIEAGADPWALTLGGWHPMDWVWCLDARRCAAPLARTMMGAELKAIKNWEQRLEAINQENQGENQHLYNMFCQVRSVTGFASSFFWKSPGVFWEKSRIPSRGNAWMRKRNGCSKTVIGADHFQGALASLWHDDDMDREWAPSMELNEAMKAWTDLVDGPQKAWLEDLQIGEAATKATSVKISKICRL